VAPIRYDLWTFWAFKIAGDSLILRPTSLNGSGLGKTPRAPEQFILESVSIVNGRGGDSVRAYVFVAGVFAFVVMLSGAKHLGIAREAPHRIESTYTSLARSFADAQDDRMRIRALRNVVATHRLYVRPAWSVSTGRRRTAK
jgi:hypothetical protein